MHGLALQVGAPNGTYFDALQSCLLWSVVKSVRIAYPWYLPATPSQPTKKAFTSGLSTFNVLHCNTLAFDFKILTRTKP